VVRLDGRLGVRFISVAPAVSEWLSSLAIPARSVTTVLSAVPDGPTAPIDAKQARARLGLSESSFVIACTARLDPVKRIDDVLTALSLVVESGVDAHLIVLGDGAGHDDLVARIDELGLVGRAHLLGHRDDVFSVVSAADCFALLSATEGLPYAPLEASVLGLPLVLTRVGALPDLLGEDAACFVPVGDPEAAARALVDLAGSEQLRRSLGTRAALRVREELSPEQFVAATMAVYGLAPIRGRLLRPAAVRLASWGPGRRVASLVTLPSTKFTPTTRSLTILTYHRVAPRDQLDMLDPSLISATPSEFDEHMRMLRSRFAPIDIDTVLAAVRSNEPLPPNAVHVTFDDGYRDVATHALPALRRHGIPATMFVPTDYPGHPEREFWWDRLYRALLHTRARTVVTPVGTLPLDGRPSSAAYASSVLARHVKALPYPVAMQLVDELVSDLGGVERFDAVMGWEELGALVEADVSVASHSRSHATLDTVTVDQLESELVGSRRDIEAHLGSCPGVFAHPAGQSSDEVQRALGRAGYLAAMSTEVGINSLPLDDPLWLRRIDLTSVTAVAIEGLMAFHRARHLAISR
jgi:peptidoglycan/xylan/chitin deacetylase (PgdA/CDA1 family)